MQPTVCDRAYEPVHGCGAVEEHTGRHGLLPHEVAAGDHWWDSQKSTVDTDAPQYSRIGRQASNRNPDMIIYSVHLLLVGRELSKRSLMWRRVSLACIHAFKYHVL